MTFDLYLFAMAFGGVTVALLVAGWAFQIHKRDFWKIKEWATMLKDGKTVDSLREQVETLKQDYEQQRREKEQERDRLTKEKHELDDEIAKARAIIRQAAEDQKLIDQNLDKRQEAEAVRANWAKIIEESNQLETRLDTLRNERGILVGEISELEAKIKFFPEVVAHYEKRKAEIEEEINLLHQKVNDLNAAIGDLEKEKHARITKLESEIAEKRKELVEQLESMRKELKDKAEAEAAELNKTKNQLKGEIEDLERNKQNQIKDIEKEISEKESELSKKLHELRDDIARESKRKDDELFKKLETLEQYDKEIEKLESEIKKKADKLKELSDAESKLGKTVADIEVAKHTLNSLLEAIKGAQGTFDQMVKTANGTVEIRKSAFKGLYAPLIQKAPAPEDENALDEMTALGKLEKHVRHKNFHFPQRLLYAFHTALKTSDISCLTVMAGVSGTGKSALPKLYSEAMGLHLCMLSVEPRWDSPRDLFGFFNYMENRYEPTQLARALIQFDQFANGDLKEQMLLVLLDEMNLARIEYYFSEYLSKLELRRDLINIIEGKDTKASREARQKVSMELFSGWTPEDSKDGRQEEKEEPIHLFAGRNVLFTGTMNEDETTQSLSDKVIDRANVLYFGRPSKLQAQTTGNSPGEPADRFISREQWSSWCKTADQPLVDKYAKKLDNLNMLMAELNRPFAHRTSKAILTYIANYPTESKDVAYADQIAMRIMPKLRGLDLSMYQNQLSRIQGAVNEANDAALIEAFTKALDNKTHGFFRWQGIDW